MPTCGELAEMKLYLSRWIYNMRRMLYRRLAMSLECMLYLLLFVELLIIQYSDQPTFLAGDAH